MEREQLEAALRECILPAPENTPWTPETLRSWIPLESLVRGLVRERGPGYFQRAARDEEIDWVSNREIHEVGEVREGSEAIACTLLKGNNARLSRMIESGFPDHLIQEWVGRTEARLRKSFDELPPSVLERRTRTLFTGHAVITCGSHLRIDRIGLPEEMAWGLFGPPVTRAMGDPEPVRARSEAAALELERIMEESRVVACRPEIPLTTPCLAFRLVRKPGNAIRLHPLACAPMNADFDGDQISVSLPLTEAAQQEAGERLSVAGQLRRDPTLLGSLQAWHAGKWGLAWLALTPEGLRRVEGAAGIDSPLEDGLLTKAALAAAMRRRMERDGIQAALDALEALYHLGFQAAKQSGASMSPFIGASLAPASPPESDDPEAWHSDAEELAARLIARTDYDNDDLGVELLLVKCGARGIPRQLARIVGPWSPAC